MKRRAWWYGWFAVALLVGNVQAGGISQLLLEGGQFTSYRTNSDQPEVTGQLDRVFIDHQRMGFFQIRLLPIMVWEGVDIHFVDMEERDWLAALRSNFVLGHRSEPIELRRVRLTYEHHKDLTVTVRRLVPAAAQTDGLCRLEGVVISQGDRTYRLARAEIRSAPGGAGEPVLSGCEVAGQELRLGLFSGNWK